MGWSYSHVVVFGSNQNQVLASMMNRQAVISPTVNDFTLIADHEFQGRDAKLIASFACNLSKELECPTMAVMEFDDDILWYQLAQAGQVTDEYNSNPDYFDFDAKHIPPRGPQGGDARRLCDAFHRLSAKDEVETVLRVQDPRLSAPERHTRLAIILRMPAFSIGFDYGAVQDGDLPAGLDEFDLVFTTTESDQT